MSAPIPTPIPPSLAADGSQDVESDHRDFEKTIWDKKISDRNVFRVIVEPNRFEACASDSEDEGGNAREDENAAQMITFAR